MSVTELWLTKHQIRVALFTVLLLTGAELAYGERLPIKNYTTADGLADNNINRIIRDSRGFLWFCTSDGLSRFDGYAFTNFGTDQGLPNREVNDFLETRDGEYWVATGRGLVRFDPKGRPEHRVVYANEAASGPAPMFTVVVPREEDQVARNITVLHEDRGGTIWCGTYRGLYRLERAEGSLELQPVSIEMPGGSEGHWISDLMEDRRGSLWMAGPSGLCRRWPDGTSARFTKHDGLPDDYLLSLFQDHEGGLWACTAHGGFFQFAADDTHRPPVVLRAYSTREGLPIPWVFKLFETSDHKFWVATARGLSQFLPDRDEHGLLFHSYSQANGLSHHDIKALGEDLGGNLWLSAAATGAIRLERKGFTTYDERDGLSAVYSIFGDMAGGVCFRGTVLGDKHTSVFEGGKLDALRRTPEQLYLRLGRFDGQTFTWFTPDAVNDLGWLSEGKTLQTRDGQWWVASKDRLYRFPAADRLDRIKKARPLAIYAKEDGIGFLWRIFEDAQGNVWASNGDGKPLLMWDRLSKRFRDLSTAPGYPSLDKLPRSFGEDRAGSVWIGYDGEILRYRGGSFTAFGATDGVPPGRITTIYPDHAGRLWLASTQSGLIRVDDPHADRPGFVSYTTAEGLSSNSTDVLPSQLIVEDLQGHIYIGTGRGLDRLDPATGRFRHYTSADGLAPGSFKACFRDRDGGLWFGTAKGLSHLMPAADEEPYAPPPVLISELRVAGAGQFISALGESQVLLPDLAPNQNELQIDFLGLSFAPGELLHYQYKLEGVDAEWSPPTEQRSVTYRLAPGRYKFLVRAVNADGVSSKTPATLAFIVLAPIWQRWWFIAAAVGLIACFAYSLYRYRLGRLLELERVRTRIAADLHDDIGANLSKIAVLSEVAHQQLASGGRLAETTYSSIASISRESVASMRDIVWAINPRRDRLFDLTRRMRGFASDTFTSRNIEFEFRAPDRDRELKLGPDVRRDVFLIFKESVNNVVRHSGCTSAAISLSLQDGTLVLEVRDDGKGVSKPHDSEGQGIAGMQHRAEVLGGKLEIISLQGQGTTVRLWIPIRGRATTARPFPNSARSGPR